MAGRARAASPGRRRFGRLAAALLVFGLAAAGPVWAQQAPAALPYITAALGNEIPAMARDRIRHAFDPGPAVADAQAPEGWSRDDGLFTLWSKGFYIDLTAADRGLDFAGEIMGATFGVDYHLRNGLIGLVASGARAELTFADGQARPDETRLTSLHLYFAWRLDNGGHLWIAGGPGEAEPELPGGQGAAGPGPAMDWRLLSFGSYMPLLGDAASAGAGTGITTALVSGLVFSRTFPAGQESAEVDTGRAHLGMEADYSRAFGDGRAFGVALELAARQDFGEALSGAGLELGIGTNLNLGSLQFDLMARTLLLHAEETAEWSLAAGLEWSSGRNLWDLSLNLRPPPGIGFAAARRPDAPPSSAAAHRVRLHYQRRF